MDEVSLDDECPKCADTMDSPRKKPSFFIKFFSVFLAMMLPIYILAYGIYQWGREMTSQEIIQSLENRTDFFMNTLENEIIRIRRFQYECLNDADLFYYVNASTIMSRFEQFQALLAMKNRMDMVKNSSGYIENAAVYIPHMNRLISARGGVDEITGEWSRVVAAPADISMAGIVYIDEKMYLCSAFPSMPVNPQAIPLYVLIIELSAGGIRDMLMSFNRYPEGGTMLSDNNNAYRITAGENIDPVSADPGKYIVVESASEYLNMNLYAYVSREQVYGGLRRYNTLFLLFSAVAVAVVAVFLISSNILVNRPIQLLVRSLKKMERGDLKVRIERGAGDEFDYLYRTFNDMAASLENLIELNYRNQLLTKQAELKQLQTQINPHFLYNSFFILYRMAKDEDYENITLLLSYLSDYYRYITRHAGMDVPLREELDHAKRYVQIQLVRFKKRIQVAFPDLPESYGQIAVPHLILQPLLENAFNHGLKDVSAGGLLQVAFVREGAALSIRVIDNGKGVSAETLKQLAEKMEADSNLQEITALVNIQWRLRLKFGAPYGLLITSDGGGGCCQELLIPVSEHTEGNSNTEAKTRKE
jgi:two-component system sensor histidine kinase YesM